MTIHDPSIFSVTSDDSLQGARIALIDNDGSCRSVLKDHLAREGFRVDSHAEAVPALHGRVPDLAVIALTLPRMNGLALLHKLRLRTPHLPVILSHDDDNPAKEAFSLSVGADDVIRKPFCPLVVTERIRATLRRTYRRGLATAAPTQARRIETGPLVVDTSRYATRWRGNSVSLTAREFKLLCALAAHPGHVLSREQLMKAIYTEDVYVDDRTVDSHIKRLRKKLRAVDDGFDAIRTFYGVGYHFEPPHQ